MADFFTDSDDDKAVEELLSQAMDASVLQQVAAVNCAGFDDADGLPSHLESRFRKLKSFPAAAPKPASLPTKSFNLPLSTPELKKSDAAHEAKAPAPAPSKEEKAPKNGEKAFTKCSTKSPDEKSCLSDSETPLQSPFEEIPTRKNARRPKKSPSFPSSDGYSSRSVSPPAKGGCFLCSPKKVSRKKSKENRGFDFGRDKDLLSDLSSSQRRLIKKAIKEEERVSREAEKIVKWAKQASARMEFSGVDDELSDDGKF